MHDDMSTPLCEAQLCFNPPEFSDFQQNNITTVLLTHFLLILLFKDV